MLVEVDKYQYFVKNNTNLGISLDDSDHFLSLSKGTFIYASKCKIITPKNIGFKYYCKQNQSCNHTSVRYMAGKYISPNSNKMNIFESQEEIL